MTKLARQADAEKPSAEADRSDFGLLEQAFARWQDELLGALVYLVGDLEDARDALQDTFVKCWKHREKIAEVRDLKAWIFRIALNTGRDLRSSAWRRRKKSLAGNEAMIDSAADRPPAKAQRDEQLALLREALHELRQEEQEVFLLRQNGQMTYDDIAEAIGIPTGTVKTRMRLALQRLRKALASA